MCSQSCFIRHTHEICTSLCFDPFFFSISLSQVRSFTFHFFPDSIFFVGTIFTSEFSIFVSKSIGFGLSHFTVHVIEQTKKSPSEHLINNIPCHYHGITEYLPTKLLCTRFTSIAFFCDAIAFLLKLNIKAKKHLRNICACGLCTCSSLVL